MLYMKPKRLWFKIMKRFNAQSNIFFSYFFVMNLDLLSFVALLLGNWMKRLVTQVTVTSNKCLIKDKASLKTGLYSNPCLFKDRRHLHAHACNLQPHTIWVFTLYLLLSCRFGPRVFITAGIQRRQHQHYVTAKNCKSLRETNTTARVCSCKPSEWHTQNTQNLKRLLWMRISSIITVARSFHVNTQDLLLFIVGSLVTNVA